MLSNDPNIFISRIRTIDCMKHTAAYLKTNERDPVWQQLAGLLEQKANTLFNEAMKGD